MLNLVSSAALLQLVTGSPVNSIGVHASFSDISGSGPLSVVSPQPQNTVITTATTTPLVAGPPAGITDRNVKFLSINNSSASPCTITVQHFDGTTTADIFGPIPLLAGYTLQHNGDGRGFILYDNLGNQL